MNIDKLQETIDGQSERIIRLETSIADKDSKISSLEAKTKHLTKVSLELQYKIEEAQEELDKSNVVSNTTVRDLTKLALIIQDMDITVQQQIHGGTLARRYLQNQGLKKAVTNNQLQYSNNNNNNNNNNNYNNNNHDGNDNGGGNNNNMCARIEHTANNMLDGRWLAIIATYFPIYTCCGILYAGVIRLINYPFLLIEECYIDEAIFRWFLFFLFSLMFVIVSLDIMSFDARTDRAYNSQKHGEISAEEEKELNDIKPSRTSIKSFKVGWKYVSSGKKCHFASALLLWLLSVVEFDGDLLECSLPFKAIVYIELIRLVVLILIVIGLTASISSIHDDNNRNSNNNNHNSNNNNNNVELQIGNNLARNNSNSSKLGNINIKNALNIQGRNDQAQLANDLKAQEQDAQA